MSNEPSTIVYRRDFVRPGYLNAEVNLYRHFVAGVIAELDRCTGLAKEHDNHHYYKVFADYVRKHLEKL